jgi:hypothetical protein
MIHRSLLAALLVAAAACTGPRKAETGSELRPYPYDTCVVMDHAKLGSMGDPITRVYEGQEVKFCCAPCVEEFEADPAKYMARLQR